MECDGLCKKILLIKEGSLIYESGIFTGDKAGNAETGDGNRLILFMCVGMLM